MGKRVGPSEAGSLCFATFLCFCDFSAVWKVYANSMMPSVWILWFLRRLEIVCALWAVPEGSWASRCHRGSGVHLHEAGGEESCSRSLRSRDVSFAIFSHGFKLHGDLQTSNFKQHSIANLMPAVLFRTRQNYTKSLNSEVEYTTRFSVIIGYRLLKSRLENIKNSRNVGHFIIFLQKMIVWVLTRIF